MKSSEANRPAWVAETLNATTWDKLRPVVGFLIGAAVITIAMVSMASAAPAVTCDQRGCSDWKGVVQNQRPLRGEVDSRPRRGHRFAGAVDANGNAIVIGGRPAGCPRLYCGCSASLYVFGKIVPELNLAANWARKFPRTSPAPGMVAARAGHVFVLLNHVEGDDWYVRDGNSGGGLTREHVRSIRGYRIVNPHGAYAEK